MDVERKKSRAPEIGLHQAKRLCQLDARRRLEFIAEGFVRKAFLVHANGGTFVAYRKTGDRYPIKAIYAESPSTAMAQDGAAARVAWEKEANKQVATRRRREQYMPLVAFCLRHFLADFIICMCECDFRQAHLTCLFESRAYSSESCDQQCKRLLQQYRQ
jgi:hypothetical protein